MAYPADEFIIRPNQGGNDTDPELILANNKSKIIDGEKYIWLSVSEVAKLGGLSSKTVRRAIEKGQLKYKVINNRYLINMTTAIRFFLSSAKLRNKLNQDGIGQWIETWKIS